MEKETTPQALVYLRVSTGKQVEGTSLDDQLRACEAKAAQMGAEVVEVYEDAGVSGGLYASRAGLQAALRDLEQGKARTLIIAKLDRYSRDREHQSVIKKRVEACGANLIFCDMTFEDTPEGDLAFGIIGSFADYERKVIRQRTMRGKRRLAESGKQPNRSNPAYGYHVVTKQDVLSGAYPVGSEGTYQIVEENAHWIREAFRRYAAGDGLRQVCRWLQETNVPTPKGGRYWRPEVVARMFKNCVYKGQAVFGRDEVKNDEALLDKGYIRPFKIQAAPEERHVYIAVPPIVDEATWELCQERAKENKAKRSGNPRRKHLLTGFIHCPHCHNSMAAFLNRCRTYRTRNKPASEAVFTGTEHWYYGCRKGFPSRTFNTDVCDPALYNGKQVERLVIQAIQEVAHHPAQIEQALRAYYQHQQSKATAPAKNGLPELEQELDALQAKEQATVKAQIVGIQAGTDPLIYDGMLREIAEQRAALEKRIKQMVVPNQPESKHDPKTETEILAEVLAAVDEVLAAPANEITISEKQGLMARLIDKIYPVTTPDGPGFAVKLRPTSRETVAVVCTTAGKARTAMSWSMVRESSGSMSYLMRHNLTAPSRLPLANVAPSGEKVILVTRS